MDKHNFSLTPFNLKDAPKIKITGNVSRNGDCVCGSKSSDSASRRHRLKIEYLLSGDLSTIIIPQPTSTVSRQYELWEHTCFEFFLKLQNTSKYWEFNLAPTGNWNVYRFLDYRAKITEETAFDSLIFNLLPTAEHFKIALEIDLNKIAIADLDLDIAITTVIEDRNEQLSYWALTHPDNKADFHHPDSFAIASLYKQ